MSTQTIASDPPAWITLNDGQQLPRIGLGSSGIWGEQVIAIVEQAASAGYSLVDTAAYYANETGVGSAVRNVRSAGRTLLVATKLWNADHGYDAAMRAFERSASRLGLDCVDLYLVHWPVPKMDRYVETWRALIKLREEKRAASIGVSNFTIMQLKRLIGETGVPPALNQIEVHPQFQQAALRGFHRENNIATQAWRPLGFGAPLKNGAILQIAQKHKKTPAQIVLGWHLEIGNVVIPKTIDPNRMAENMNVFGFKLDDEDLARISVLDRPDGRTGPDPESFGVENSRSVWGRRIASLLQDPSNFSRRVRRYMGR